MCRVRKQKVFKATWRIRNVCCIVSRDGRVGGQPVCRAPTAVQGKSLAHLSVHITVKKANGMDWKSTN